MLITPTVVTWFSGAAVDWFFFGTSFWNQEPALSLENKRTGSKTELAPALEKGDEREIFGPALPSPSILPDELGLLGL